MIIFLDGPINAGKSTVGALLAGRLPHAVHIDVDCLRHFAVCLTLEQAIPYAVSDAANLTRNWVQRGFHVIVSWPIGKADFRRFAVAAAPEGTPLFAFTLLPALETALSNRGDRQLSHGERARIREMYVEIYGDGRPVGHVLDNSDQTPVETVEMILEHIKETPAIPAVTRTIDQGTNLTFTVSDQPAPADEAFIRQRIRDFNDEMSEYHRQGRRTGKKALAVIMRSPSEDLVGGLLAATYWNWLDIDELWVVNRLRGKGFGRKLMQLAEKAAVDRGCRLSQVKTWDFQARGFYERLGYRVLGRQADYPPGQTLYWLRKELIGNDA